MFAKILLNSRYMKHGVSPSKTAQKFGFRRAGNVVIDISMEDSAVNVLRYGSNILQ